MLTIPGEVHFWTLKDDVSIPETDFGAFRYHEKKDTVESLYLESKKSYAAGRGITWSLSNKKSSPVKRESLKELEDQLSQQRVVSCHWRRHDLLQILLASGLIVSISVNVGTGDIISISFDKFLLGKLPSECLTDVVYGQAHIFLAFSEAVLGLVHLSRPLPHLCEKLTRQEARLVTCDLGGPSGRRLERKLCLSADESMLLVWWRCAQDEVYPWSPVVRDCDRANILIYSVVGPQLNLLCYYKSESDPISVHFSQAYANTLLLVEQKVSRKGEVSIESSRFELTSGRLARSATVSALQLQTQACCIARSPDETRLALGCIDGSVLLYSSSATLLAKASFIPSLVAWHPNGSVVVVANEKGQLQTFDLALAPIRVQLLSEEPACTASLLDITPYFRYQPKLCSMHFNKRPLLEEFNDQYAPSDGYLLLLYERGPLCMVRLIEGGSFPGSQGGLSPDNLVTQYLRLNLADQAINLLGTLSWDVQGATCLACMHRICNHLLASPLSPTIEGQLEAALGTFMSPSVPLSLNAERQFGRILHHLARRFFHHLLRYQRFETAFRLAIDLGDRDLFLDIFHCARGVGDETLAQLAKQKVEELKEVEQETSGSESSASVSCDCSHSSCSVCGSSSSSCSGSDVEDDAFVANTKPTKVTFSDTVTHVEISSNEEEEEDEVGSEEESEDESQALIVSDAPSLRVQGAQQERPEQQISTSEKPTLPPYAHPDNYLPSATNYNSPYTPHIQPPGVSYGSEHDKIPTSENACTVSDDYYRMISKRNSQGFIPVSSPQVHDIKSPHHYESLPYMRDPTNKSPNPGVMVMARNTVVRSSNSSIVNTPSVQQANITSLSTTKPASTPANRPQYSPSLIQPDLPILSSQAAQAKVTSLNEPISSARIRSSVPSVSLPYPKPETSGIRSREFSKTQKNLPSLGADEQENIQEKYSEANENSSMGRNEHQDKSLRSLDPSSIDLKSEKSTYFPSNIIGQPSRPSQSYNNLPLLYMYDHGQPKQAPPLSLRPKPEDHLKTSDSPPLPLLTLRNSPLYLSPYPPRNKSQRESNNLPATNTPLFRIGNLNPKSTSLKLDGSVNENQGSSGNSVPRLSVGNPSEIRDRLPLSSANTTRLSENHPAPPLQFPPYRPPPAVIPRIPQANSQPQVEKPTGTIIEGPMEARKSPAPNLPSTSALLHKIVKEGTTEDEEALNNIKVVHFGVV